MQRAAPVGVTSVTSAAGVAPSSTVRTGPPVLLGEDPNATHTTRLVRVKSVTSCGTVDGRPCLSMKLANEVGTTLLRLESIDLFLYDGAGKLIEVLYLGEKDVRIPAGATVDLTFALSDDDAARTKKARTVEAEIGEGRLEGAPQGREWHNHNLTRRDRPIGGFRDDVLKARSVVTVRALSFDPKTGVARLRNEGQRATKKLVYGEVSAWERRGNELRTYGGCESRDVAVVIPPGGERDVSLANTLCPAGSLAAKPDVVAFTVDFPIVQLADGSEKGNSNLGYNLGWTRPLEDLPTGR